jgi:DNA modification methylase
MEKQRRTTSTRAFGAGKREGHDATDFYARFAAPIVSDDDVVVPCPIPDTIVCGDSRDMADLPDSCVALVVTSPPYFAGKSYETELGEGAIPANYVEFLKMLEAVFAECVRVLEPGGRMAVNVANLGRKPYRSLSSDVTAILQDQLGLLLRGEILWQKADGAGNNCAWGSFQSAANPVLRDMTERIIIASKGRFDRAKSRSQRQKEGLPHLDTITKEMFMESTVDVWKIRPESAKKVGHPAPFPLILPERLINLYTYKDDVVLDPFMGAGTTAVAAAQAGRRYVGYELDQQYIDIAQRRIDAAVAAAMEVAMEVAGEESS